jgi:hypothetical protein
MSNFILKTLETRELKLNTIRLRGFYGGKLRKGSGGGGSGDGFPVLPGDVTRWHFGGLTNEMMAAMDDPRIEDADHKGRFLSFKNFAWCGMGGVGGYKFNFKNSSEWNISLDQVKEHNDNRIVINNRLKAVQLFYRGTSIKIVIKLTGVEENNSRLKIYDNVNGSKEQNYNKDGIYEIDYIANDGAKYVYFYITGGNYGELDLPITIEQLPLYPGALVFDGVDDYGTCDNFPILTKERGYTVVALRQWISTGEGIRGLVSNVKNWFKDGAFILEYSYTKNSYFNRPVSFGAIGGEKDLPHILTYQTSKSYNGVSIAVGSFIGTDQLYVGKIDNIIGNCTNAAIWELVFLDHDATEEELTKIKDYFIKTYPWLFPDQAWTVTGKTNEDEDRATIANITGNGNDLVLSNLGFIEGSGYNEEGEYAGYLVTDGVDDKVVSAESIAFTDTWTIITDAIFLGEKVVSAGILVKDIFGVSNLMEYGRVEVSVKGGVLLKVPTPSIKAICSDGRIYDADWNEYQAEPGTIKVSEGTLIIGMWYNGIQFCSIAFKNLGIYNNQLLSKDDCIKAYNYLQTLKAK